MAEITIDTLHTMRGREIAHYNYGSNGYGYMYRSVEFPRLSWMERTYKGAEAKKMGKRFARLFYVDGDAVGSALEDAVEPLGRPPVLTEEEQAALDRFPIDWTGPREAEDLMLPGADAADQYRMFRALANKGLTECKWFPEDDPQRAKIRATKPMWRRAP